MAEVTAHEANEDGIESRRDASNKFTLGPGDSLEGKLSYGGSLTVQGRAEGELHIGGNVDVASGATVKASIEGSNVTVRGEVEGAVSARDKLMLGKSARLSGDINVKRLQIEDGASLNGHVRMGSFEQQGS
ncbi:MAG TPA: polymer-forming cytoskeletal protein [Candidatus Dormibacteraeota bacterium]|nr:polymer-forming cytoskeletal protein [Candidatus Dormibacteraeota bacterium]